MKGQKKRHALWPLVASFGVLLAAFGLPVLACSEEVIVLATVPAETNPSGNDANTEKDGGGPLPPVHCRRASDCDVGMFCDRHGCADAGGTCVPLTDACGDEEDPICGCDGITYWNDCLRRSAGVGEAVRGICPPTEPPCDNALHKCATGAVCARLGEAPDAGPLDILDAGDGGDGSASSTPDAGPPPPCPPTKGRCWVLPAECPAPTTDDRWNECGPPNKGLRCVDTCTAMKVGKHFGRAPVTCE